MGFSKHMGYAPIARIILRYLSGGGVVAGALGADWVLDPDIIMMVSFAIGSAVEFGYFMAKKFGWAT